jgi:co-chaperonin GroES (HSP10)
MNFQAIGENIIAKKIKNYEDPSVTKPSLVYVPENALKNDFFIAEIVSVGNMVDSPLEVGNKIVVGNGVGISLDSEIFLIKHSDIFAKVLE